MAIIADQMYNLRDAAAQFGPDGQELAVAEVLSQTNDIIGDMLIRESNLDSGHEYAVRTGIPAGTWRRAYQGVDAEKATQKVVLARPGTLGAYSVVDKLIAEKGGHVDAVRAGQSKGIIAGMSDTVANALIYGGKKELEKCVGLSEYYNTTKSSVDTSHNVVNAGGTAAQDKTSIYLVVWDSDKVYGFFPKGSKAGISRQDFGLVNHLDTTTNKEYPAYKEYFEWQIGLAVQDWRYAARIANINTGDLANVDLYGLIQDAEERIQKIGVGKAVLYMNRTVRSALRKQLGKKANVQYAPDQPGAKPILSVDEIPVHICDAISNTESLVSNN